MSGKSPIECAWDPEAEVFRPIGPYQVWRAARDYGGGEVLLLGEIPVRSGSSHGHLFAVIDNAWESLPPLMAERFPTAKHFRKYLLVKAGHSHSDSMICASHAEAERVAAFTRTAEEFAVVTVDRNVVTRFVPKSLSHEAVPSKEEFQKIKDNVMRVLGDVLEVTKKELGTAGHAA
jgi:hypothetical protein